MATDQTEPNPLEKQHDMSRLFSLLAAVSGAVALVLACVGVGSPNWEIFYTPSASGPSGNQTGTANFFYACTNNWDGSEQNCTARTTSLTSYGSTLAYNMYDHLDNAAALSIIGIIFIFFGIVGAVIMSLRPVPAWLNLLAPGFLFVACLFMLAALAEGSRILFYNGYAANLYEAGHLCAMFSLFLCSIAAGRFHTAYSALEPTIAQPVTVKAVS